MVTIIGNNSSNILQGTANRDAIHGLGGNDRLYGNNGNDTIYGDAGNDYIVGGLGNDRLYGGTGNDSLSGGDGLDVLYGGSGINTLRGGQGEDTYFLTSGAQDTIVIAQGESKMHVVDGDQIGSFDTVYNFSSNDKLDLPSGGVMRNTTVNTTIDTLHFKSYSISNGILSLKSADTGGTAVAINTFALALEANKYLMDNLMTAPSMNDAVALRTSYSGAHTLVIEPHSAGDITIVDIIGTLTLLSVNQVI